LKPDLVAQACDPSTEEAEAIGSHVQAQQRLHSETLSQKKKKKRKEKKGLFSHL
jgi:hypothetical protein